VFEVKLLENSVGMEVQRNPVLSVLVPSEYSETRARACGKSFEICKLSRFIIGNFM
jgi:hypothetical protein